MSMIMRRAAPLALVLVIAAAALAFAWVGTGGTAEARGLNSSRLENAGWACFDPDGEGPLGIHCSNPGEAGGPSVPLMVFSASGDDFHGTEQLLRDDLYHGQPCPQEDLDIWVFLPAAETGLGADYDACHH